MVPDRLQDQGEGISFRQLRLFESVGRLGSVRRGSEECNLSQPAVTQALAKLEQLVGVALLDRGASGSDLTDTGLILHRRTRRMFDQIERAIGELGVLHPAAANSARRITRSQVRVLIAIIAQGSFPAAARALGITQASLQRAARDLESSLGQSVYCRTAAGVMVTPEGIEFGRKLKLALQEITWALREIAAQQGDTATSRITIGALPFGGSVLLASVLEEFMARHPRADLRITNEGASEMMKRLRSGDVDLVIGLAQETSGADLAHEFLAETPWLVVARRGHPLTRAAMVTLEDLARYDWVVGAEGSSRRACFDALFRGAARPKAPIATSSISVIRPLLSGSGRLTLMTSYELTHQDGTLAALPFRSISPVPAIGITMRADWLPTALHRDFLDLLRARVTASTSPLRLPRVSSAQDHAEG
ncbi:LysR family transcriptional regulator [Novosphingobium terrae]|uniref:LysR family transcriptional regulator n=1 Tax=Novosphingobium terrae TaxID=2726189 RepID=UPI00198243DE|nr:LysR family transcriptional regulator [Novosphingobium terrae]